MNKLFNIFKNSLLLLVSILFLENCKHCDEMCAGLAPEYKDLLDKTPSSLKYTNGNGVFLIFNEVKRKYDEPTLKCFSSYGSCICHECRQPSGYFECNNTDTTRKQLDSLGNFLWIDKKLNISIETATLLDTVTNTKIDTTRMNYYIMGNKNSFIIEPIFKTNGTDSLLVSFSAGGNIYNNVVKQITDTSFNLYPGSYNNYRYKYFITVSYFSKEQCLIAFYDNLTNSLFYRTN